MTGELWKFQDNWIVLDVLNTNDHVSEVNLFDVNKNYTTTNYEAGVLPYSSVSPIEITVRYVLLSSPNTLLDVVFPPAIYLTINSLVAALNANPIFIENGSGIFYYEMITPTSYTLLANSSNIILFNVTEKIILTTTLAFSSTGVVTTELQQTPMNDIVQELVFQPYIINTVDIFASNVAQANQQFSIGDRSPNGTFYEEFENPSVNPIQPQSALLGIELNFSPSPTNFLKYKMNPYERVRMIFKYSHIKLENISESKIADDNGFYDLELNSRPISDNYIRGVVLDSIRKQHLKELGVNQLSDSNIKKIVAKYLI